LGGGSREVPKLVALVGLALLVGATGFETRSSLGNCADYKVGSARACVCNYSPSRNPNPNRNLAARQWYDSVAETCEGLAGLGRSGWSAQSLTARREWALLQYCAYRLFDCIDGGAFMCAYGIVTKATGGPQVRSAGAPRSYRHSLTADWH
jgi:hypothetical protein